MEEPTITLVTQEPAANSGCKPDECTPLGGDADCPPDVDDQQVDD